MERNSFYCSDDYEAPDFDVYSNPDINQCMKDMYDRVTFYLKKGFPVILFGFDWPKKQGGSKTEDWVFDVDVNMYNVKDA